MIGIVGVIAAVIVLGLSLVIMRVATIALMMTGMPKDAASFQVRSAFTGTGFTTKESEQVVNHPVRRRIVMWLMILRSAGLVSIGISLILSFVGKGEDVVKLYRLLWLAGGVGLLWLLSRSRAVDRALSRAMRWALTRWTHLDLRDYSQLLRVSGGYAVTELEVRPGDWLEGKKLSQCRLQEEGVMVLGILRRTDGRYVGAPKGDSRVFAEDTLILYGRSPTIRRLDDRLAGRAGDVEHDAAVGAQQAHVAAQDRREAEHARKRERDGKGPDEPDAS